MHFCWFDGNCWASWFSTPEAAAWTQAVATFLAVLAAIVVPYCQNRHFQRVRVKEKDESRNEALIVVTASLEQVLHTMQQIEFDLIRYRKKGLVSSYVEMIRSARETLVKSPLQDVGRSEVVGLALRVVRATAPVQEMLRRLSREYERNARIPAFEEMEDAHAWGSLEQTVIRILADVRGVYEVVRFFLVNGANTEVEVPPFKPIAVHVDEQRIVQMTFTFTEGKWSLACTVVDSDGVTRVNEEQIDMGYPGWHQAYSAGVAYADRLMREAGNADQRQV
ncbi:MAG: hypothetical protein ACPHJ2_11375 [Alloalcanivorax xenomutans]